MPFEYQNKVEVNPIPDTFYNSNFYTNKNDGALVFYVPYNGLTTSGSIHPRSELRELNIWKFTKEYSSFSATLAVNDLAVLKKTGEKSAGKLINCSLPFEHVFLIYFSSFQSSLAKFIKNLPASCGDYTSNLMGR